MYKSFNGATFRRMVNAANIYLENNKKYIDSLNVYPVPDGDTGNNMSMTLKAATKAVNECQTNSYDVIAEALSTGAMRGARGNSGVILSQILRGISIVIGKQTTEITTKVFAKAMKAGVEYAYKAVLAPKEGTILTVIRVMSEIAEAAAKKHADFEGFFDQVLKSGEEILEETPELLPVLKAAGVVDAGGRGLLVIFNGFYKGLINEDESLTIKEAEEAKFIEDNSVIINYDDLADIKYGYCTEFMIIELKKKTTVSDIDKLRENLLAIGDSINCVGDLNFIKIHVHTNEPNRALGYALELGEIHNIKIENMVQQNRELKAARAKEKQNTKPFGMVSVATGDGIKAVFKDLGADEIIEGGQTMNPSAEDIAKAVDKVSSDHVFVFPNNKNIIMAAEQARNLTKRFIHVIPTISIPEGISSMLAFNMDGTVDENIEAMNAARNSVSSGAVTYAVRKTQIDGFELNKGDIIGLANGEIKAKDELVSEATIKLVEQMMTEEKVNITLFFGNEVKEEEAEKVCEKLQEKYPECEVSVIPGNQPVYYYLISVE